MKDLAPDIIRQRLLIEGFFSIKVRKETVAQYLKKITKELKLRTYAKPIIYTTGGRGKEANKGFDAFVPLIDSGISVYIWVNKKFFSAILYTCKHFDEKKAMKITKDFFKIKKIERLSF